MKDLNKFVDAWEKTGSIEEIISQNLVLPPSEDVQAYLSSLPQDEHDRIRKSLNEALTALGAYTSQMEEEALSLKAQIDQNIQTSNACLAYNKKPSRPRS